MSRSLLSLENAFKTFARFKGYVCPGGVKYPGGIRYYPRFPDQKDPEVTPSKLFRVERIRSTRHQPFWLKKILQEFQIDEEHGKTVTIVKNIPEVNMRLWKVKHLIRVTPIVYPYGEPTADDINHTVLRENGQCLVVKSLNVDQKRIEAKDKYIEDPGRLDGKTIQKHCRLKWLNPFEGGY